MPMSGRDCVLATLEHQEPERLPVDLGGRHATLHIKAQHALRDYYGLEGGEDTFRQFWLQTVDVDPRLTAILGGDVAAFSTGAPDAWKMEVDAETGVFYDEWGASYRMPPGGYYFDYHTHPLQHVEDIAELDDYTWPEPLDSGRYRGLRDQVKRTHDEGRQAIMQTIAPAGSWEHTWTLRGPEQALLDLVLNRDLYEEILSRTVSFQLAQWERTLAEVGDLIDIASISDDLGTQTGPLMSPVLWRELFKPRMAKIVSLIKSKSKARVYIHTDGSVYDFLPDFVEIGIDIINPVQRECKNMDLAKLKREFGEKLIFWGAGCTTRTLEYGSPEQVRAEAKEAIRILAPGGGYVFASIHNIQALVPPQNVEALFKTAQEYGRYPIQVD
jgi:uroporphyrinogen decarboxylase